MTDNLDTVKKAALLQDLSMPGLLVIDIYPDSSCNKPLEFRAPLGGMSLET